jgi:hypothetical protein
MKRSAMHPSSIIHPTILSIYGYAPRSLFSALEITAVETPVCHPNSHVVADNSPIGCATRTLWPVSRAASGPQERNLIHALLPVATFANSQIRSSEHQPCKWRFRVRGEGALLSISTWIFLMALLYGNALKLIIVAV